MQIFPYVDIIIVTYNGGEYISRCLESLFSLDYPKDKVRIIVVDNASQDNICELLKKYENIEVILNKKNYGFAYANNIALKISSAKYALLLNQDSWLKSDYVSQLVGFMEANSRVAICGGAEHPYDKELNLKKSSKKVSWVGLGATLLRLDVMRKIGFLDDVYFMYWEDVDLCWRCFFAGWEVWYNSNAVWHHDGWKRKISITDKRIINSNVSKLCLLLKFGSFEYMCRLFLNFFKKEKKIGSQNEQQEKKRGILQKIVFNFLYIFPKVILRRYVFHHYVFFNQKKADEFLKEIMD